MLSLLNIKNVALIKELELEFGGGLNLLTGETGSGKSIIVDSLGALIGDRISSELIKEGEEAAHIEGLFAVKNTDALAALLNEAGIESDHGTDLELIIRRDLARSGKKRIFVNNQLVTQNFLKRLGGFLVDIHGQGEQTALFDVSAHLEILDEFAEVRGLKRQVAEIYHHYSVTKTELGMLKQNESEKLQLLDILKFQVDEIKRANLRPGEEEELDEEKRRLNNVEKLSALSDGAYSLLYENAESTAATLDKAGRKVLELGEYDSNFREYKEGLAAAQAVIEDLAIALRDFRSHLEFLPERLEEIESRLAEIARLKRKYGESVDAVLVHLKESENRLENIETAEFREEELSRKLESLRKNYLEAASNLHAARVSAAAVFEKQVERNLRDVALEKAQFKVLIESPDDDESGDRTFSAKGFDRIEFYFSANPGESPKPLARIASGGEASRLMLILKTTAKVRSADKSAVFDEVDVGIGGRVAEAVGLKLKELSRSQQVLCVTHQPQIASLADRHFVVSKQTSKGRTDIGVVELGKAERIEEIARMLAGERITDAARENARVMIDMYVDSRTRSRRSQKLPT
jgi:DNA repair protein RecN (Recombination protein N)